MKTPKNPAPLRDMPAGHQHDWYPEHRPLLAGGRSRYYLRACKTEGCGETQYRYTADEPWVKETTPGMYEPD